MKVPAGEAIIKQSGRICFPFGICKVPPPRNAKPRKVFDPTWEGKKADAIGKRGGFTH